MNRIEVLERLREQSREEHIAWVQRLGQYLTIAARSDYAIEKAGGDIFHLMGFNEIQHRVYGYSSHCAADTDWGVDAFVDSLHDKARAYGVEDGLRWSLGRSLPRSDQRPNRADFQPLVFFGAGTQAVAELRSRFGLGCDRVRHWR